MEEPFVYIILARTVSNEKTVHSHILFIQHF